MTSPNQGNQTPAQRKSCASIGGGFTPRSIDGEAPIMSPGLQKFLEEADLTSSSDDEEEEDYEEEEEELTYDQVPFYDSVVDAGILKVPKNVGDYLLDVKPEDTLENLLLTTTRLPSSDEFVAAMAANPGTSLIAAAGQSHLQESHAHALLQAELLQVQIQQWSTTLANERTNVQSLESFVEDFEGDLAREEEKLALAHRKVDLMKAMGKKHRAELAAKRSTCIDAHQKVGQQTQLQNIATLLGMVCQGLRRGLSEELLKNSLPFAQLQDPWELATMANLDYEKVKDRTCRQYIGIVRHIFLFGYQFSMAYTQVGPGDREQIVLTTQATKKQCRRVVCKILHIGSRSPSASKAVKRKRRSSTSTLSTLSKKARTETLDTAVELLSVFSTDEIDAAKAAPGSLSDNLRSIHRKKSADRPVRSQDDSSGDTKPAAI
jgi:hypothetical protein